MTKNEKISKSLKAKFAKEVHHAKGKPGWKPTEEQKNLTRLRTIVVTGGASQTDPEDLFKKILLVFGISQCEIFMDIDYILWTNGLLNLEKMIKKDS